MRRWMLLVTVVVLAGCLGGQTFDQQAEMTGTFTVGYDLNATTPQIEYRSAELQHGPEWQRQDVQVRFFQELIDFSVYRHHVSEEAFVCYTSNSSSREDDCLFLTERALWPLLPTADPGVFSDDPVSAVKIGPGEVNGRECNEYRVRALSTYYYDVLTGGNESEVIQRLDLNVNQINSSMCIDTRRNYIAAQNMTVDQPGTQHSIRMEATSYSVGADPAPGEDLVLQARCGLRSGRLDILPISVSGEATVSVNGDNRSVTLEEMEREEIGFGRDVASRIDPFFIVEVDGQAFRTGCS